MENAPDALDFDLYVEEKKKEAVALQDRAGHCQVDRESGWIRSLSQAGSKERAKNSLTLGRNLTRLTSIIDHDFGTDESQMLDKISAWERQIEEHVCISGEKIADSVKCAVIQKGMPSDWTAMRRSIQLYLLATASAPRPVPMDLGLIGYLSWSNKGEGKDSKDKGYKGGGKE
eukprot:3176888-Amphidinium_carterae.1